MKLTNTKETGKRGRERERGGGGEKNGHKCRMQERGIQTKNDVSRRKQPFLGE
jgi:hypothetical protein